MASSTRARCRWSKEVRRVCRVLAWEEEMDMFGGVDGEELGSVGDVRWGCAEVDFSRARERRASALRGDWGDGIRVWERERVRHLVSWVSLETG